MKTNFSRPSFILVATITLTGAIASAGCLSEAEKKARRDCALDVAGDYTEVRPDGTTAGTLHIDDESSKNDVMATYARGALFDGEQAFIDRIVSDDDKTAVKTSLVFGKGDDPIVDDLMGGQNYSDDFGQTDTVGVSAPSLTAVVKEQGATDPKIVYGLSVAIANGSDQLTGSLTVTFSENEKDATSNDTQAHSESKSFDVVFKRTAGVLQADQSAQCKDDVDGK